MANTTLVHDVVERHNNPSQASSRQPFNGTSSSKTGFPPVQHRSKRTSAFKRARLDQRTQTDLNGPRVIISDSNSGPDGMKAQTVVEDSMLDISRSNAEAVERMTPEERERERQDILDQLGSGISDLMTKVREARARRAIIQATDGTSGSDTLNFASSTAKGSRDSLPLSPPLRSTRRIRFLDPTEADIHVYESHPSSPKRTLGLLPPPSEAQDKTGIVSLGSFKGSLQQQNPIGLPSPQLSMDAMVGTTEEGTPEEGTPEDIRRRYFPSELPPEDNPALTWMLPTPSTSSKPISPENSRSLDANDFVDTSFEPRYSLSGARLSPSQIKNLPTHLGLHHHASLSSSLGAPAGYTLPDLLLLARSSVPAQRASILGVLAKVLQTSREEIRDGQKMASEPYSSEQNVDVDAMRRDVLDAAIDALGEKGGVGQRAVDLLWEALVGFIHTDFGITHLDELPCVDLSLMSPSKPSSTSQLSSSPPKERIMSKYSRHSAAILVSLPLLRILPALKIHLITSSSPLSLTHSRVLDILFVLSHFPQHARTIVSSDIGLIGAMMRTHLQPPDSDNMGQQSFANTLSIRVLQVLARCGRDVAATLSGPADVLLRYVMTPLPPMDLAERQISGDAPSLKILTETIVLFALLAQYGFYAHVATIAQNEFTQIGNWLLTSFRVVADPAITRLACAYLKLLETLIVCATDPHMTTPSHDILWSQVRGWDWIEWTLDFTDVVVTASKSVVSTSSASSGVWKQQEKLWGSIFYTLASYVEGATVNGVKRGEGEREVVWGKLTPLFEGGCTPQLVIFDAIKRLQVWEFPSSSTVSLLGALHTLADAADLLAAVTRLALACLQSEEGWTCKFPGQDIHNICIRFVENDGTQELFTLIAGYRDTVEIPEDAHTFVRVLSLLLFMDLQMWRRSITPSNLTTNGINPRKQWMTYTFRVLHILLPGDEDYAKWIFERLCEDIDSDFVQDTLSLANLPDEQWNKGGMTILLPFLTCSLRPTLVATTTTGEDDRPSHQDQVPYLAPLSPTPESTAHCTKLLTPSLSHLRHAWMVHDRHLVLPIRSDWPTWPLNHLLRSGSSPVFRQLPPNWDAAETDVVRASLLLARLVQELCGRRRISHRTPSITLSRSETVFACMKVFMLEHEQQQLDSGEEVFRDTLVTRWMDELLTPFTCAISNEKHQSERGSSLEQVSEAFLSTPFFQFYSDFLGLYDAISFSHPLFGRLLLPPISMSYAVDYRKLLFGDYGHALRTINTSVADLICEDVREYLWPVEDDAQLLGWYFKALLTPLPSEFIRWMAVHHLALNIWPDSRDGGNEGESDRGRKLLSAIVRQGNLDFIRDIACYRQLKDQVWPPPKCYKQMDRVWVGRRLDFVERLGDQRVKEQLHRLFKDII